MAKRISATRQQYNIERERATRRIQRQVKVPISVAREMLPTVPKRVTQKSISELKQIRGKHGKYTRNFISELYEEYTKSLTPKEFSDFYTKKAEFAKESVRRSEIARKRRALPEIDKIPEYYGVQYGEEVGDEVYVILNEIDEMINNALNWNANTDRGKKYEKEVKQRALDLREYFRSEMKAKGREQVAKYLNNRHDETIKAVDGILYESGQSQRENAWGTINSILALGGLETKELATAQMDETYSNDNDYVYPYGYAVDPKTGEVVGYDPELTEREYEKIKDNEIFNKRTRPPYWKKGKV